MTTALRAACTHQTIGDSHGTRRERISFPRKIPSTWKTSMRTGTMTMYYAASTGVDCQKGMQGQKGEQDPMRKHGHSLNRKYRRNYLSRKERKTKTGKHPRDREEDIRTLVPSLGQRAYYQYNSLQSMPSNSLKLGLLLGLHPNHFPRDCPCQHCRCSCHNYRLPHPCIIIRSEDNVS